jgi:hypothetical protein
LGIRELPTRITDEHFASEIGGLYRGGWITKAEYDAGARYGKIILDYLKTIDAPSPYSGGRCEELADEICLGRKLKMAAAREVLKALDPRCAKVVDRVAVYGEGMGTDELPLLRAGLRALAGSSKLGPAPIRDAAGLEQSRATIGARANPNLTEGI